MSFTARFACIQAALWTIAATTYAAAAVLFHTASVHPGLQLVLVASALVLAFIAVGSGLASRRLRAAEAARAA
jgi:hypothetical protein